MIRSWYAMRNWSLKQLGFASYAEYLKSDLWKGISQSILSPLPGCQGCGERQARVVHHRRYTPEVLSGKDRSALVGLCAGCHYAVEHDGNGKKVKPEEAEGRLVRLLSGRLADRPPVKGEKA